MLIRQITQGACSLAQDTGGVKQVSVSVDNGGEGPRDGSLLEQLDGGGGEHALRVDRLAWPRSYQERLQVRQHPIVA